MVIYLNESNLDNFLVVLVIVNLDNELEGLFHYLVAGRLQDLQGQFKLVQESILINLSVKLT